MDIKTYDLVVTLVFVTLIILLLIIFSILLFLKYRKKRSGHLLEKQKLRFEFNEELLQTQLEIQEQTFKTISQEIHDNIGQLLTLAKLNLNTVDFNSIDKATEKINDSKLMIAKAIQDLRDLSKALNTDTISAIGVNKSIELELKIIQKTGIIQTYFELIGTPEKIDPKKELILFRIIQESLHNIIKHANATHLKVSATYQPDKLVLIIIDDGDGFDYENSMYLGSGLRNMQSRGKIIGGNVEIQTTIEKGTQITITLPIKNNE